MPLNSAYIRTVRSLKDKKFRDAAGLFVAEGEKLVAEALKSSFTVEAILRKNEIGEKTMQRISQLSSPSPVLAVIRKPEGICSSPVLQRGGLYLALDSIRDPGNMGTILRIADWFGVTGIAATPDSVDIFNPKTVQSTMGAIFRVNFHYCDLVELCSRSDAEVYGTFLDGESIYPADLSSDAARIIVIGNESSGISPEVAALCRHRLTIPSFALKGQGPESLNAAVATALTVSEFRRREL